MTRRLTRALSVTGLTVGVVAALTAPASAAPTKGEHFTLTCAGTTYQVSSMGNGDFTPAHDLDSNKVFIPHAFQGFSADIYDLEGTLVDHFEDDGVQTQGSGKQRNDLSCTFTFNEVSDGSDPEGPPAGYTIVGSGGVTGQVAGH